MKKKTAETTGQLIYAGPTITNVVKQYTIYTNGLPKILEEKIEEVPAIKKLIVPVNRLREVRDKIETTGTAYNVFYKQIEDYIKGGK